MSLPFTGDDETDEELEQFGARVEGEDDPKKPLLINGKEWWIQRYDPVSEEVETYAGAWPRAMIENTQAEPKQPLWIGVSEGTGREVPIKFNRLFRHVFYGGTTGTGKTTKMYNDAVALMYGGWGVTVIDPKGDDIYDLLRRVPRERWNDVIYIAPGDDYLDKSVGFNLFATYHEYGESGFDEEVEGIVDDFKELLKAGDFWGNRMDRVMKTMVRGMIRHEFEFTPMELYYALLDEEKRKIYADLIGDADDEDIAYIEPYTRQIADELSESDLDALVGRLKDWVENPITRQIIAQRDANVSIAEAVNEGKIIICKNNLPGEAKRMVATAVMRRVWTCVNDRTNPSEKKIRQLAGEDTDDSADYNPYFLMIDECDDVLTEASQTQKMLTKARSKKLGLLLATQNLRQIDDEDTREAILSNCNTLFSLNPLHPDEARILADRFGGMDPNELTRIPDYHAQTKLHNEDDPFLAKLTPPYPPLHSIEDVYELIQLSISRYGLERQSGRKVLDKMFFNDVGTFVGEADEDDEGEPTSVDDLDAARDALKAIYDESIRQESDSISISLEDAEDAVTDATGFVYSQASSLVEKLVIVGAIEQRSTADGDQISVTPEGCEEIGLGTGAGGSGGGSTHRRLLRTVYEWGTRLGYDVELPSQDDDGELPDAIAELPTELKPDERADLSDAERDELIQSRLEEQYPEIATLSGSSKLFIEAESEGLTGPYGPIKNAAKAPSPEELLFVVADGGNDGLTKHASHLASIFGVDGSDPYAWIRCPADVSRKLYTGPKLAMNPDRSESDVEYFAVISDDVETEWVELESGAIVCRERGGGDTYLRFDDAEAFRDRSPSDAPATYHYDIEDGQYVVERDGSVYKKYPVEGPLKEDWTRIYTPMIPEIAFPEYGYDEVPEPDAWRIAIVPNDDRELETDLMMYDSATDDAVPIEEWIEHSDEQEAEPSEPSEPSESSEPEPSSEVDRDPVPAPEPPAPEPDPEVELELEFDDEDDDEGESSNPFDDL
jgi:hypothetical protein